MIGHFFSYPFGRRALLIFTSALYIPVPIFAFCFLSVPSFGLALDTSRLERAFAYMLEKLRIGWLNYTFSTYIILFPFTFTLVSLINISESTLK